MTLMAPHLLPTEDPAALLFDLGRVVIDFDIKRTLACWADHAGRAPADIMKRFVFDDLFWRHETGKINNTEFFAGLRSSLGINLSDEQFLEGWNATFIGEMPDIAGLLAGGGTHSSVCVLQ
jgi:glucose-1-phosphatase